MSAKGQTETSAHRRGMSVPPPIADLERLHAQVRSVPQADIADALLNHFICDAQRGRYRYPQRLRGLAEISAGICSKRTPPK
jgi:hypothetical protein